jgi:hypothetical protein
VSREEKMKIGELYLMAYLLSEYSVPYFKLRRASAHQIQIFTYSLVQRVLLPGFITILERTVDIQQESFPL